MGKRKTKVQRIFYQRLGLFFLIGLVVIFFLNIVKPSKEFSSRENRKLQMRPALELHSVVDGSFMKDFEAYFSDQFLGRNGFVWLKTKVDYLGGKRKEKDVFYGKGGQLVEEIKEPSKRELKENERAILRFAKANKGVPVQMLLVPNIGSVKPQLLPKFVTEPDQQKQWESIAKALHKNVQMLPSKAGLQKEEKAYYKTDHHWTTKGAYQVFLQNYKALGIDHVQKKDFIFYPVTDHFNGTLAARSGYGLGEKEIIDIAVPRREVDYLVSYPDQKKVTTTLYDRKKLSTRDKYGVFLGGNAPEIQIKTNVASDKRLLLIKDSYANTFVQFLLPYYQEIVMVDPRYYTGNIQQLMEAHQINQVLFLYNMNTFVQDNNISGVMEVYGKNKTE